MAKLKKLFTIFFAALLAIVSCNRYDEIWEQLRDHEERIQKLELMPEYT